MSSVLKLRSFLLAPCQSIASPSRYNHRGWLLLKFSVSSSSPSNSLFFDSVTADSHSLVNFSGLYYFAKVSLLGPLSHQISVIYRLLIFWISFIISLFLPIQIGFTRLSFLILGAQLIFSFLSSFLLDPILRVLLFSLFFVFSF